MSSWDALDPVLAGIAGANVLLAKTSYTPVRRGTPHAHSSPRALRELLPEYAEVARYTPFPAAALGGILFQTRGRSRLS
jgi:hypothetical protein